MKIVVPKSKLFVQNSNNQAEITIWAMSTAEMNDLGQEKDDLQQAVIGHGLLAGTISR